MTTSVVSIVYVNDAPAAARFYGDLLGMSPSFETPGYITFDLGPGADLGLWSGQFKDLSPGVPRTGTRGRERRWSCPGSDRPSCP